jgi:hypothetical protein
MPSGTPDFSGLLNVMQKAGSLVVDDIVANIVNRIQPDGSPQKEDAASTIRQKKQDHPLIGGSPESPLLANPNTYAVEKIDDSSVSIRLKQYRAKVGVYVENKGFHFFAISKPAADKANDLIKRYIKGQIHLWWMGKN